MKMLYNRYKCSWIKTIKFSLISMGFLGLLSLIACSQVLSGKMPSGDISMEKAYQSAIDGGDDLSKSQSQSVLRDKVKDLQRNTINTDNSVVDNIDSQFPQLPNPSIAMYVYPHFVNSGNEQVPVPSYFTAFHLYDHDYYVPQDS